MIEEFSILLGGQDIYKVWFAGTLKPPPFHVMVAELWLGLETDSNPVCDGVMKFLE